MSKTKQPELILQGKMVTSLKSQNFLAIKTSDRFKAGRPDLRISHLDHGQIDFELKYLTLTDAQLWYEPGKTREFDTGLSKLQWLKIREMNRHGMPAVGLVYIEVAGMFVVTTLLRDTLLDAARYVKRGPSDGNVINGAELMTVAKSYLKRNPW